MLVLIVLDSNESEVLDVLKKDKTFLKNATIVAGLLLLALAMRYVPVGDNMLLAAGVTTVRNCIHFSLLVTWCISLHRRLLHPRIRVILVSTGVLMVFWLLAKTVKYEFLVASTDPIGRYIWYSYYIPMLLIPLFGMFIVYHIGKPDNVRMPKWMMGLLVVAIVLILLVLTNDLHQWVFRFDHGFANYDQEYSYGFLYFILMAWYILFSLYFGIALLSKCRVPGSEKVQKLPLFIVLGGVVFWTIYILKLIRVDLTVIDCLIIASLLESAIQSGMIPSNTNYQEIFRVTTVPIHIVDVDFQPRYVSAGAMPMPAEHLRQSEKDIFCLGNTLINSAPITAGRVVWQDDISRINELRERLQDAMEQLSEEGVLLQAETELKQNRAKADEQNRLYDRIAREVEPQLIKVDGLLQRVNQEPENAKVLMAKVCIIGSYIKRRGNLLLLGEESPVIQAAELEYCIRESLENFRLSGARAALNSDCDGLMLTEHIVAAYDFYELLIECLWDSITALMVNMTCRGDRIYMNIQMGCAEEIVQQVLADVTPRIGHCTYEIMDEDVVIVLTIEGGDQG